MKDANMRVETPVFGEDDFLIKSKLKLVEVATTEYCSSS